ncbi:hypothetical protein CALVIDRAFT_568452 [Calocera viscosa TUFC12733]|uniref:Uncharacterized protein n=1 Tax=Calocera viscosa (strain TUFC12733) TaxID=1330018 RepID=A0A167H375_CALVF|nr:hypothetical protein CALVIDRAFT_568452 [Calocera viscosa TUFC12733]
MATAAPPLTNGFCHRALTTNLSGVTETVQIAGISGQQVDGHDIEYTLILNDGVHCVEASVSPELNGAILDRSLNLYDIVFITETRVEHVGNIPTVHVVRALFHHHHATRIGNPIFIRGNVPPNLVFQPLNPVLPALAPIVNVPPGEVPVHLQPRFSIVNLGLQSWVTVSARLVDRRVTGSRINAVWVDTTGTISSVTWAPNTALILRSLPLGCIYTITSVRVTGAPPHFQVAGPLQLRFYTETTFHLVRPGHLL